MVDVPTTADLRLYRRERVIALGGLLGVAGLAWLYLWWDAARMDAMPMPAGGGMGDMAGGMAGNMADSAMPAMAAASPWAAETLFLCFAMWAIMMVGMMLPSAAPAILMYGSMVRKNRERGTALPALWVFAAGYLAVWTAFSALAALLQAWLETIALVTPMMVSASAWLSGGLLVAAGIYQWLPVKQACLEKCRAPLQFFMFRWRAGTSGAFRMGAEHGAFCLGCCWALMLLLFVAGVMNLLWVALIAAYVFVEKLLPAGPLVGRLAGGGMVAAGIAIMVTGG